MKNIMHGNISYIQNEKILHMVIYRIYEMTKMSAITEKMKANKVSKLPFSCSM